MSELLLKEKYQIVKAYLNQIDPSFRFIQFPLVDPKAQNVTLRILHLKTLPTLTLYKAIESDLNQVIDETFVTKKNLMQISKRFIENLQMEREIMQYNQKLRGVQISAHKDLLRIFLEVRNIIQEIEKNLTLVKKGHFINMLFTNIKQLNVLIGEVQLIYQALSTIEIKTSIDLLHYIGLFSDEQNSKLLIAFNYDENAIEMIEFLDHILLVLEDSFNECEKAQGESEASKSAYLALQMKSTLDEGKDYFQVTNSLYHQLCAYIYLEFKRMIHYTKEELKKLEPYITKINKNICEILYLHFIKKRETEKIKDTFTSYVKEIQIGIKEPLDSKQNFDLVKSVLNRSNQLIVELRHCKEVYNLYTAECFTAFFERKKMKRKNTIKSLKNEILLFQQTLTFIEEIIKSDEPLKNQIRRSKEFMAKVNQLEVNFQEIIQKKVIRSKLPHQNVEINQIRFEAKKLYSDSEDVIVDLLKYKKQFEQYYDVSYISIFEHLFEKNFFELRGTINQLYEIQDKISIILQKESKILGTECSQIHHETQILLRDIYEFLSQVDVNVITKTDNKNFLDEIGSNILKILMRLKKKQAQIEINLQDESLIVSHKLSSELLKMFQSLSYQLTNLEGLGMIIESRQYFNLALIINSMYEFLDNDPQFIFLDQILTDLPEHKKDVEEFVVKYSNKVSSQLRMLAKARIELEQFFYHNFKEMKQCHLTIISCHKLYTEKYKNTVELLDSNFLNVITPITTSYQKINNIIIDITSNRIFQEEIKRKLRDSLNKYQTKLKQVYVTDERVQIQKTAHVLLFYSQIKDEICNQYHIVIGESLLCPQSEIYTVLKNISVPSDQYISLIKDMKWARVHKKVNGDLLNFVNMSEYNSLLDKTYALEDLFLHLQKYMLSIEQAYAQHRLYIQEQIEKQNEIDSLIQQHQDLKRKLSEMPKTQPRIAFSSNYDREKSEDQQLNSQKNNVNSELSDQIYQLGKHIEAKKNNKEKGEYDGETLDKVVEAIVEQMLVKYKYEYDLDVKKMAIAFMKLLETLFPKRTANDIKKEINEQRQLQNEQKQQENEKKQQQNDKKS